MKIPGREPGSGTAAGGRSPSSDVDDLVRGALRDDLPAEIEARLARGVERFVAERAEVRRGAPASSFAYLLDAAARLGVSPASRVLVPVASSFLLIAGIALAAAGHRNAFADSFSRANLPVSLFEEIRRAPAMSCSGFEGGLLSSQDSLADAVYRRFALVRTEREPDGATRVVFRSRDEGAYYEFVVDAGSLLPRAILRTGETGGSPEVATCTWEAAGRDAAGPSRRSEP